MSTGSHYRLERTRVIDQAGTPSEEVFVTTSRDRLIAVAREALKTGHFSDDNLVFAIEETVTGGHNALALLYPLELTVHDGSRWQLQLVPDLTVTRGAARLHLQMLRSAEQRIPQVRVSDGSKTFASLSALGDDATLLAPLREARGNVSVELRDEALVAAIPALAHPPLAGPVPFRPFFENADFAAFLEQELEEELVAQLPGGTSWDGLVPLERWFPAGDLLRALGDAGHDVDEW